MNDDELHSCQLPMRKINERESNQCFINIDHEQ